MSSKFVLGESCKKSTLCMWPNFNYKLRQKLEKIRQQSKLASTQAFEI
jgi:hypothetical protein